MTENPLSQPASERRHDLDWLRLIAILILLLFHTGMWFNTWDWHVKNNEQSATFDHWMIWLHHWRMPLLLFISGAGTYMAMSKRTAGQFAGERFRRLFIPLVFGMFVVVPPQIYFEHIAEYQNYWDFYKTVFEFVPYPVGSFSWHHLWFIIYLLLYSLWLIPFLIFIRSPRSFVFKEKVTNVLSRPLAMLLIPSSFILFTQVVLRPYFPEQTHDLKDWAFIVFYLCFFFFGILCYSEIQLWQSIGRNRKVFLTATVLVLIPFYAMWFEFYEIVAYPWSGRMTEIIFDVSGIYLGWFTVITLIAYGQHYLNKPRPWLSLVNEGLYPFYILHQTVIIAIGYYICQLPWAIPFKFFAIALLTLGSCIALFMWVIRPFNVVRVLFGLKSRTSRQVENTGYRIQE